MDLTALWISAGSIATFLVAVWAISVVVSDASIVDIAWGSGFVIAAWTVWIAVDGSSSRRDLLLFMVTVWGVRLAGYLAMRNLGHGEDKRYVRMRRKWGDRFWIVSLITVFALQGLIMWTVSLPVQIGMAHEGPDLGWVSGIGVLIWFVGLGFEAVGDYQLRRFVRNPENAERTLKTGLWGWTRHPNYFGDACVWTGIGLVGLEVGLPWGPVALLGPAVMTFFLVRISGKALLERDLLRRRPGYAEYVASTSGFFPLPPKR